MAIQVINIGSSANKGDGDPLRTAFKKINDNFAELDVTNKNRDINGSVFADDSTLLVDAVNGTITASVLVGTLPALNGSNLTNLTIPAQTFASLTGTPTTLAGYGITDAISSSGDYTQNGSVTFNDDDGIIVGTNNNLKINIGNDVNLESTVNDQDFVIKVKPLAGTATAIKVDTGTQRVGIFRRDSSKIVGEW